MAEAKVLTRPGTLRGAACGGQVTRRAPARAAAAFPRRALATTVPQTIKPGDTLPDAELIEKQSEKVRIRDLFKGAPSLPASRHTVQARNAHAHSVHR